jgi:hypothetical protein
MRNLSFSHLLNIVAAGLLVGCGGPQSPIATPGRMPQSRAVGTRAERGGSWMMPEAKSIKRLLYLSNAGSDVFVYNYDNFEKVGTLTGLDTAAGECVDGKGDVWILEDTHGNQGGGNAVEYAHGGTTVLNEVATDGPPGGCSISPDGDLEITDAPTLEQSEFGPGEVQIWKSASGTPVDYGAISSCYFLSSGGYDNKGNLYVTGAAQDDESSGICELSAGGNTLIPVTVGKSITDPVGVMWDGKYMAITDVWYRTGDIYATTIFQTKERRNGGTLKVAGHTTLADTCFGNEVYISPPPFIIGKKNTPVNTAQGTGVAGFNFICGINPSHFRTWAYPAGGSPVREINIPDAGGEVVSIAP